MTKALKSIGAITLFAEDLAASKAFYEDVFGLTPVHVDDTSAAFDLGGTIVNVLQVESVHSLIAPAAVAPREAGARVQLSVEVEDTDAVCAELQAKGVSLLNGPVDQPWGLRTASFTDPAGHIWEVAQGLPRDGSA